VKTLIFNRLQYADDFKRVHHGYEQTQYRNFKNALDTQIKPVIDFVRLHGVINLRMSITVLVSKQPIQGAYLRCYENVGVEHASWAYKQIDKIVKGNKEQKGHPTSFFSEYWRKLMRLFYETDGGTRITQVTDTTRDNIMSLLDDAEEQGMTTSQQADYIMTNLNDPDFNRDRALRIARTESTTAANRGAMLGGESSDYETGKIWIPILDMNTRPDHAAMAGCEPIGMQETFAVGDSQMSYPGDPSGSAREVVNCRCSLAIVPLADDRGLPIMKMAA